MPKEQFDNLRWEVGKIANDAEQKLVEWAIAYVEEAWPDGPDQRDENVDEFHVLD